MTKLVVLKFSGSLESGFIVDSTISDEGKPAEHGRSGKLPPAEELNYCLNSWQQQYEQLDQRCRIKPQQVIYDGSSDPHRQLTESARKLQKLLLQWLNSESFSPIDKHLRSELNRESAVRILICSDRPEIYQLPWCCWDLVDQYPDREIAVSSPNFNSVPVRAKLKEHQQVKILAILGDSQGIELDTDRLLLDNLDGVEVKFLVEPTISQLDECLWQETWDIIFFAGHSRTLARQGILYLNSEECLTIEDLKHGFRKAIASGLQLAIFNSCDGLGLAEELNKLSLPLSIVMRLPIPDEIAQQFIRSFLQTYSGGDPLYSAMRRAREQLQSCESDFPCASWLPIIYQNPAVIPPQWSDFYRQSIPSVPSISIEPEVPSPERSPSIVALLAGLATVIVLAMQFWGWLQPGELNVYDRLMLLGYNPPIDPKVIVVTVGEQDFNYQREQNFSVQFGSSLADAALDQLLQKLNRGQAKAIALDILHDFPFDSQLAETVAQTKNFVAICRIGNLPELESIAPPPQLALRQLGFSNWAIDDDGGIRRQMLGMSPGQVCTSSNSLSLSLALTYLGDIPTKLEAQSPLEINNVIFPPLQKASGGYQLPEAKGYQILLDYRRPLPQTVTLRDILTMPQAEVNSLVQDKMVLIGVIKHKNDQHDTPYSRGEQAKRFSGVKIHALMTSQIVDVVLGERKLLGWASSALEILWIGFWSAVGALIIWLERRSPIKIILAIVISLAVIFCCCWLALVNGVWLIAIAPVWGLILAAMLSLTYPRRSFKIVNDSSKNKQ